MVTCIAGLVWPAQWHKTRWACSVRICLTKCLLGAIAGVVGTMLFASLVGRASSIHHRRDEDTIIRITGGTPSIAGVMVIQLSASLVGRLHHRRDEDRTSDADTIIHITGGTPSIAGVMVIQLSASLVGPPPSRE